MLQKLHGVDKKQFLTLLASIVMLVLIGVGVEYFGFGHKLNSLPEAERGVAIVENADVVVEGFMLNEKNEFVFPRTVLSKVLSKLSKLSKRG